MDCRRFIGDLWYNMFMRWNHWIILGLGVWLILSPWILGFSSLNLVSWNNLLVGALAIIFSLWNLSGGNSD